MALSVDSNARGDATHVMVCGTPKHGGGLVGYRLGGALRDCRSGACVGIVGWRFDALLRFFGSVTALY